MLDHAVTLERPDRHRERAPEPLHPELLLHYVEGAQKTAESIDQLGNFLMGLGALTLGYLLQTDLAPLLAAARADVPAAAIGLLSWAAAVVLLLAFAAVYIFRMLAGRRVHAPADDPRALGEVLEVPADLDWAGFVKGQETWRAFLRHHYDAEALRSREALLYARWSALRFMTLRKLADMQRMRRLLAGALVALVAFKLAALTL